MLFRKKAAIVVVLGVALATAGEAQRVILIRPQDLPPPYATRSVNNPPLIVPKPKGAALRVPPGFHVAVFAGGLNNPRQLTVAPNGDVFCVESAPGRVTVFRPGPGGRVALRRTFASGLTLPFGIAFWKNYLYVAETNAVVRFACRPGQTQATGRPEVVVRGLPGFGYHQHWTRDLVFSPDGRTMLVSVGSRENVGTEAPPRACIVAYHPDGSGSHLYATGLRNAVALAFNPVDGRLWATVNERDGLGEDVPPDYVTSVREGGFYGWPYTYIGARPDPRMPRRPDLARRAIVPDMLIETHSAPLGIAFYTGSQFPQEYRNDAFVALHGSWNRRDRTGYKVIRIPFHNGRPTGGYEDFLTGWMLGPRDRRVWGRPVGLAVAHDGSLLVTDDGGNKIWRVSYAR
ncbi:MAG TPA: sorbosone dehydrogenase family protein [Chthonomonadaceae bacterium]|nr:sorbosone dehydrogenase family protein [Chthonomonadaceae bacterium]